ncbi:MAG TPA: hypothetical protein VGB85_23705 [Nannocystis sp.]|jgi:hypothetical protein
MALTPVSLLPLLLLVLAPACVINKDLLDGATSGGTSSGEDPGGSTEPTTGGPEGEGSTSAPGTTTGDATTGDGATTGSTTTGDTDGPMQSELIIFGMDEPLCMPVCAVDKDPATPALEASCNLFAVDVETQDEVAIAHCMQVGDEWVLPAGQVRCYEELIDRGGETSSPIDQMSPVCVDGGFNVEFLVILSEPLPEGVVLGATCEASSDPEKDCPKLDI